MENSLRFTGHGYGLHELLLHEVRVALQQPGHRLLLPLASVLAEPLQLLRCVHGLVELPPLQVHLIDALQCQRRVLEALADLRDLRYRGQCLVVLLELHVQLGQQMQHHGLVAPIPQILKEVPSLLQDLQRFACLVSRKVCEGLRAERLALTELVALPREARSAVLGHPHSLPSLLRHPGQAGVLDRQVACHNHTQGGMLLRGVALPAERQRLLGQAQGLPGVLLRCPLCDAGALPGLQTPEPKLLEQLRGLLRCRQPAAWSELLPSHPGLHVGSRHAVHGHRLAPFVSHLLEETASRIRR
mmetsp:Transcript_86193/g.278980  ORF Transcript_86193/g.278980 Transcript_86193/m.278980 type:complete len:301 (-) Transcript_86193:713-1615(-)